MPEMEPSFGTPEAGQPHPPPAIGSHCRAARIGGVRDFADCLANPEIPCAYRFTSSSFHFCEHPLREVIIARTLAG
jgi:hypothetical protein